MSSVIVVGSFNVDHVWTCATLPRPGETLGGDYHTGPGGKGFNQATAAARADAQTHFVCALGDDIGGQLARALAVADGIDLRDQRSEAPTGTAGIYVDAEGRNCIVIGPGANAALTPAFIDTQCAVLAAAAVVLAQLESPADAIARALRVAREAGALTVLNPAPANAEVSIELLELTAVLTPNETEFAGLLARQLGETITADSVTPMDDARLHALCRRLLPHGSVVVTLGAAGCFVSHAHHLLRGDSAPYYRVPAAPVQAIDSTGAGDAFNGALAASLALLPSRSFHEHVRFASRFAALSTESVGAAVSMPRRAEVQARFGD